ncbi:MAG TPA: energy transducer TonB [Mucilaginibacter sp.]|nr:energy transducer TonB [Mucilaginibacter sp.]
MPRFSRYLILLILLPIFSYSQGLKLVEEHPFENVYIQYTVLASNAKIRHGIYQKFLTASRRLVEEGYYKSGKKDSLWVNYNILGDTTGKGYYSNGLKNGYWKKWSFPFGNRVLIREGNYKSDLRVGIWTFRKADGSLDHKYDYSTARVTGYGKTDDASTIIDGKDTVAAILEKPPVHIGGMDTLYEILARNIRVPVEVKRGKVDDFHYRVFVSIIVDETGRLVDYKIARGSNKACNNEALRVIKLWDDGNWVPGNYKGRAVKVVILVAVVFNMNVNVTDFGPLLPPNARILH